MVSFDTFRFFFFLKLGLNVEQVVLQVLFKMCSFLGRHLPNHHSLETSRR